MKDHLIFDTTSPSTILDSDSVGAFLRDAAGKLLTSQLNGTQQALDVGINVAGVQIDPRQVRALTAADVVTVQQGTSPWVVSATALDIRHLNYTLDNVAVKGATGNQLIVNADGSLNVNADISVVNGSDKVEDSASATGAIGTYVLAVRQDTLAVSTTADGNYTPFKTSAAGALYVNLAESSATISVSDTAIANTAVASNSLTLGLANTAQAVVAAPISARKYLWIYNFDNNKIFLGGAGVTAANGFPLSPGSQVELRAGSASPINFVGSTGKTPEIRTLQMS